MDADAGGVNGTAEGLPEDVVATSNVLKALAHPARLMIVTHLMDGEKSVGAIERDLDLRQPSLSQQLRHLREAGVVATRREAKSVYYRLDDPRVARLMAQIGAIFGHGDTNGALAPAQPRAQASGPSPCAPRRQPTIGECAIFPVAGGPIRRR